MRTSSIHADMDQSLSPLKGWEQLQNGQVVTEPVTQGSAEYNQVIREFTKTSPNFTILKVQCTVAMKLYCIPRLIHFLCTSIPTSNLYDINSNRCRRSEIYHCGSSIWSINGRWRKGSVLRFRLRRGFGTAQQTSRSRRSTKWGSIVRTAAHTVF